MKALALMWLTLALITLVVVVAPIITFQIGWMIKDITSEAIKMINELKHKGK